MSDVRKVILERVGKPRLDFRDRAQTRPAPDRHDLGYLVREYPSNNDSVHRGNLAACDGLGVGTTTIKARH